MAHVARFIIDATHLRKTHQLWRSFSPDATDNETSVFRLNPWSLARAWDIADAHVVPLRGPVAGVAELAEGEIPRPPLELVDAPPPTDHMAIRGWPAREQKDLRMMLAKTLASKAQVHEK